MLQQSKVFGALMLSASQPASSSQQQLMLNGSQDGLTTQATSAHTPDPAGAAASEQWVDKHEPHSPDDLVVHKRKVGEVTDWLTGYQDSRAAHPTRVLLVTGPPGCGKSATLRVCAASLNIEVLEWAAPTPTLWDDYQYQAGAGVGYSSKLDEFDRFVTRCKFAALPLASESGRQHPGARAARQPPQQQRQSLASQQPPSQQHQQHGLQRQRQQPRLKLLLVDDLPYVGDAQRRARLAAALQDLAFTARSPVVVITTTEQGSNSSSTRSGCAGRYGAAAVGITSQGLHKDLLAILERAGAATINFNPVTANMIMKALHAIADKEGFTLDPDTADGIAQAAAGDLRSAVQNLQLLYQRQAPGKSQAAAAGSKKGKGKAPRRPHKPVKDADAIVAAEAAKQKAARHMSRDQQLSVYHAIGKILHYKRHKPEEQQQAATQQQQLQRQHGGIDLMNANDDQHQPAAALSQAAGCGIATSKWWYRSPIELDPESIVQGSGLEPVQVAAFLAENYTHFLADDAMQEAANAAAYLSHAGYLACYRNTAASTFGFWDEEDTVAGTVQAAASISVAARGLLFSNTNPAPSRWLPLKGPSCNLPDKAAAGNLVKLSQAVQKLQDSWQDAGPLQHQAIVTLAGQLLHPGRQERAAQVLPYLQVLCRHQQRLWLHHVLPKSWWYLWNGEVAERQSWAVQAHTAPVAIRAALLAAAAHVHGADGAVWQDRLTHIDAQAPHSSADEVEGIETHSD
eukprot:GHRR01023177.1.p1 GENE.GHRR01023177.1~~GHRR01023177.1.p1  ORF type:complete len:741 (+),score=334.77 GHRR01023177.1:279-2501(+)